MNKTYSYLRVSSITQVDNGHSLQMQEERINAYCISKGLPTPQIFSDKGISGRTSNRPALQELLSKIKKGDTLLVYSLSRFMRNTVETLNAVSKLNKDNINFVSLTEDISTNSPSGKFFLTVLAGLAQLESETTGERIASVLQNRKSKKQSYCKSITGYNNVEGTLTKNEHYPIIQDIFNLKKQGFGSYKIASMLNKNGKRTISGKPFLQSSIESILNNEIYATN